MNVFQIYGMGERAASFDLRGGTFRLWNRDPGGSYQRGDDPLYLTMPLYLSQRFAKGYLIFYENSFDFTCWTMERVRRSYTAMRTMVNAHP